MIDRDDRRVLEEARELLALRNRIVELMEQIDETSDAYKRAVLTEELNQLIEEN